MKKEHGASESPQTCNPLELLRGFVYGLANQYEKTGTNDLYLTSKEIKVIIASRL